MRGLVHEGSFMLPPVVITIALLGDLHFTV